MLESAIERKLRAAVASSGGLCLKFTSPGYAGVPDRMVLMPGGRICFVELKAPGCKPRPLQLARHGQLRALGFKVFVVDGTEQIAGVLDALA